MDKIMFWKHPLAASISSCTVLQQLKSLLQCSTLERTHVARKTLKEKKLMTWL